MSLAILSSDSSLNKKWQFSPSIISTHGIRKVGFGEDLLEENSVIKINPDVSLESDTSVVDLWSDFQISTSKIQHVINSYASYLTDSPGRSETTFTKESSNRYLILKKDLTDVSIIKSPIESYIHSKEHDEFRCKLLSLIELEPIEDGYSHPVEQLIDRAIGKTKLAMIWIFAVFNQNLKKNSAISATILRCIGRFERDKIGNWGIVMAMIGLSNHDVEVREAAIRAFEVWGGDEALNALKSHNEPIKWLKDYKEQVIKDLLE